MNDHIVEEYLEYLHEIEPATFTMIAAAASIFSVFNIAFNLYKQHFTKAARQCKDLPGKEKALCMLKAKAAAKEVQLNAIKRGKQKCAKTKDPQKCAQKFDAKMSKIGGETGFLKSRMAQLAKQKYAQ